MCAGRRSFVVHSSTAGSVPAPLSALRSSALRADRPPFGLGQPEEAIVLIGKLFEIERELKHATPKHRKAARKQRAGPVVDAFHKWCAKQSDYAIEQSPLHRALTYANNQRDALGLS